MSPPVLSCAGSWWDQNSARPHSVNGLLRQVSSGDGVRVLRAIEFDFAHVFGGANSEFRHLLYDRHPRLAESVRSLTTSLLGHVAGVSMRIRHPRGSRAMAVSQTWARRRTLTVYSKISETTSTSTAPTSQCLTSVATSWSTPNAGAANAIRYRAAATASCLRRGAEVLRTDRHSLLADQPAPMLTTSQTKLSITNWATSNWPPRCSSPQ